MTTDDYVVGHVRDALAQVGETDVWAAVDGETLVLSGTVATVERRQGAVRTAAAVADGLAVVDRIEVLSHVVGLAPEELS